MQRNCLKKGIFLLGRPISNSYSGDLTRSDLTIPGVYEVTLVIHVLCRLSTICYTYELKLLKADIFMQLVSVSKIFREKKFERLHLPS